MRGLPACGKTEKALKLVDKTEGIICDPHKWFEEQDEEFRQYKLTKAKRWAWYRGKLAAQESITPIVIDMHVGVNVLSTNRLKDFKHLGYTIELVEPDSKDWQQIRALLYNKMLNRTFLDNWAEILAKRSPYSKYLEIRTRMNTWRFESLDAWKL